MHRDSQPSRQSPDTSQEHRELRRSSSMGSLYISTTICKPCIDSIINSVATILHSQMIEVSVILHDKLMPLKNLTYNLPVIFEMWRSFSEFDSHFQLFLIGPWPSERNQGRHRSIFLHGGEIYQGKARSIWSVENPVASWNTLGRTNFRFY